FLEAEIEHCKSKARQRIDENTTYHSGQADEERIKQGSADIALQSLTVIIQCEGKGDQRFDAEIARKPEDMSNEKPVNNPRLPGFLPRLMIATR
ncbi:MAG: hypothetical protein EBU93_07870, partial [Chlamydiae bacterium]|nr:hypothetical protein [Chlamydiota bacterium]